MSLPSKGCGGLHRCTEDDKIKAIQLQHNRSGDDDKQKNEQHYKCMASKLDCHWEKGGGDFQRAHSECQANETTKFSEN